MTANLADLQKTAGQPAKIKPGAHIGFFDGIRGGLSVWVLFFHAAIMAGFNTGFIPPGLIAVDIFMLISGFMMAYTLSADKAGQDNFSVRAIIAFYFRRVFRIVPVYYLILLITILFYTSFATFENQTVRIFPPLWAADMGNDPSIRSITFLNIILHLTFLSGLNPHYASNMPIPDWSLSLEMQFYAIVPFLLIAFRKYGLTLPILALAVLNFLALKYIGLYLVPKVGGLWPQPSLLVFKIDCFVIGMLLAFYFIAGKFNKIEILSLLIFLLACGQSFIFTVAVAACFAFLEQDNAASGFFMEISRFFVKFLQTKVMRFLGDISYDLYLIHPLILLTISHFLLENARYVASPAPVRFAILVGIAMIILVPVSYLVHIAVERPCHKAARPVWAWLRNRKNGEKPALQS